MPSKSLSQKRARIETPRGRIGGMANWFGGGKNPRKSKPTRNQKRKRSKRQILANRIKF